jgi:putative transposase
LFKPCKIESTTKQSAKENKLMANHIRKLTDQEVLEQTCEQLQAHLSLQAQGYRCQTEDLYAVLLGVAARRGTLEEVCGDLTEAPCAETVRRYLHQQLPAAELARVEMQLNAALVGRVPKLLLKKPQEVAIDFHDEPYYGKQPQASGGWIRAQRRGGTTRFYRIATAYVIHRQMRLTLAMRQVRPEDTHLTVLKYLLRQVRATQVQPASLYLDKAFAEVTILRFLSRLGQPAVIACSVRGKTGGTRALCQGRSSYRTQHTFRRRDGQLFTAPVAVCRVFTTAQRTGRMPRRAHWILFIVIARPTCSPERVRQGYRRRFGIESSYRCARKVLGWTTSPNRTYRFTLLALALLLVNVWVQLQWGCTQVAHRGGRWLETKRLRLSRLAKLITRALEERYGCVRQIEFRHVPIT